MIFLPVALAGFWVCARSGRQAASVWLILASLTFYGFWAPYLIVLIGCSILFNYGLSLGLRATAERPKLQTALLAGGVTADLAALFYYKYLVAVVTFLGGGAFLEAHGLAKIVLPLGISFFTFTQIGYLVDCRNGAAKDRSFRDYVLFVTFFPHLIAGPLLHNTEMMPQFADRNTYRFNAYNTSAGLTMFMLGMLKKSLLADNLSPIVKGAFDAPDQLHLMSAWTGALCYSLQLYFDFSGYTDMAIGLALLFNVRFPTNFNSPYKARNIIDFWQRWHITLTRFLTQYLYNPVALSIRRRRAAKGLSMAPKALKAPGPFLSIVVFPTVVTMTLAGVWHGAGLQFLVFGVLHGIYLAVNHGWRMFGPKAPAKPRPRLARWGVVLGQWGLTYLAVLVAQVFFRADSVQDAWRVLAGMVGAHGVEAPGVVASRLAPLVNRGILVSGLPGDWAKHLIMMLIGFAICLLLPNTQEILAEADPILSPKPRPAPRLLLWRPSLAWAAVIALAGEAALLSLGGTSEFLYFQF